MRGIGKTWKTILNPQFRVEEDFLRPSMFPCPMLLDTRFILFPTHFEHLIIYTYALVLSGFSPKSNCPSQKEGEGVPKNDRNRRHRESIERISASFSGGENRSHAFLHVPIPTALRDPLFLFPAHPHALKVHNLTTKISYY